MAQHRTSDTGQMSRKYFSHIYTQPGQGHLGLVLGNRVNPKGLWEAGPAVGTGGGGSRSLREDVRGLHDKFR